MESQMQNQQKVVNQCFFSKTSVTKDENPQMVEADSEVRFKKNICSTQGQSNVRNQEIKGQYVISYNFDHVACSNAVTRNIFIGWDDQPVKKINHKPKSAKSQITFNEKPMIRNRLVIMNKTISKGQKKNSQQKIYQRLNSVQNDKNSLVKFPYCGKHQQNTYHIKKQQLQQQSNNKTKQAHLATIDIKKKTINNKKSIATISNKHTENKPNINGLNKHQINKREIKDNNEETRKTFTEGFGLKRQGSINKQKQQILHSTAIKNKPMTVTRTGNHDTIIQKKKWQTAKNVNRNKIAKRGAVRGQKKSQQKNQSNNQNIDKTSKLNKNETLQQNNKTTLPKKQNKYKQIGKNNQSSSLQKNQKQHSSNNKNTNVKLNHEKQQNNENVKEISKTKDMKNKSLFHGIKQQKIGEANNIEIINEDKQQHQIKKQQNTALQNLEPNLNLEDDQTLPQEKSSILNNHNNSQTIQKLGNGNEKIEQINSNELNNLSKCDKNQDNEQIEKDEIIIDKDKQISLIQINGNNNLNKQLFKIKSEPVQSNYQINGFQVFEKQLLKSFAQLITLEDILEYQNKKQRQTTSLSNNNCHNGMQIRKNEDEHQKESQNQEVPIKKDVSEGNRQQKHENQQLNCKQITFIMSSDQQQNTNQKNKDTIKNEPETHLSPNHQHILEIGIVSNEGMKNNQINISQINKIEGKGQSKQKLNDEKQAQSKNNKGQTQQLNCEFHENNNANNRKQRSMAQLNNTEDELKQQQKTKNRNSCGRFTFQSKQNELLSPIKAMMVQNLISSNGLMSIKNDGNINKKELNNEEESINKSKSKQNEERVTQQNKISNKANIVDEQIMPVIEKAKEKEEATKVKTKSSFNNQLQDVQQQSNSKNDQDGFDKKCLSSKDHQILLQNLPYKSLSLQQLLNIDNNQYSLITLNNLNHFTKNKKVSTRLSKKQNIYREQKQYGSIGVQVGDTLEQSQSKDLEFNVDVGTSVKEFKLEEKLIIDQQVTKLRKLNNESNLFQQRKVDGISKGMEQLKQQNQKVNQGKQQRNYQDILKENSQHGNNNNLLSSDNISCSAKLQPPLKQSFLQIEEPDILNKTDFQGGSIFKKQRKLNKGNFFNKNHHQMQYQRAPILSYIYGEERKIIQREIEKYQKSEQLISMEFTDKYFQNHKESIVGRAVSIILQIDPWLLKRIVEPYTSTQGTNQAWLYCKSKWRPFQSNQAKLPFDFIYELIAKAALQEYGQIDLNQLGIQGIIRMITGLRVMQLKNRKKLAYELQYYLKRGNIFKGISSNPQHPTYNIIGVETTAKMEKLIQIQKITNKDVENQGNDIIWIKEEVFQKYFDAFLLICYREESYWTCKYLNNSQAKQSLVYTLDSLENSIGSLQLNCSYDTYCKVSLYREIKPKLLKFVGQVCQKIKPIKSVSSTGSSICFNFMMKGRYYLLINLSQQVEKECNNELAYMSMESSEPVEIKYLQSIEQQTLKNSTSEYIEINSGHQSSFVKERKGSKIKSNGLIEQGMKKDVLLEQFVSFLMGKEQTKQ